MGLTSMASFSDAHETPDIPVIAANLHRLIQPRQSQIWAVLHAADSDQRLVYLLTGGFLGRLCLSGEIASLNEKQWTLVKEAIRFYGQIAGIIAQGNSRVFQKTNPSWQHLQGAQAVLRAAKDEKSALLVTHSFGGPHLEEINIPLPEGNWQVAGCFPSSAPLPKIERNTITYRPSLDWEGNAVFFTKK